MSRGLDVAILYNAQGRGLRNVVDVSIEYDFFSLCYVPHHFLGFPLEIIRYAETPSHKLNFEERKQLDEDVSVAEVEQSACVLEQSP